MSTAQDLLPDPNMPLSDHSELQLLAVVLFGEARGVPTRTRKGIGHAVINRALNPTWWGKSLKEVILKPWQFSSFNGPEVIRQIKSNQIDPNYRKLRVPLEYEPETVWEACCQDAIEVYQRLMDESIFDPVMGANHYYDTSIPAPRWADPGRFVISLPAGRAQHKIRFYRL